MQKITIDLIIEQMKEWVEEKHPISPSLWLDSALKINVMIAEEDLKLVNLESEVSKLKWQYKLENETSVAESESYVRASDKYKEWKLQDAKLKQIQEYIRLAKKFASLKETEMSL